MEYTPLTPISEWIDAGDIVIIDHVKTVGKVFKVVKRNPRKFKLVESGTGRQWNADHGLVKKAPAGSEFVEPAAEAEAPLPVLQLGTVVEFTDPRSRAKFPGLFVVANVSHSSGQPRYRYVKLGGDRSYVTGDARGVRVIELSELRALLV